MAFISVLLQIFWQKFYWNVSGVVLYQPNEFCPNHWFWLVAVATERLNFLACNINSILAEYSLHSCTFRWALWPMGLWFRKIWPNATKIGFRTSKCLTWPRVSFEVLNCKAPMVFISIITVCMFPWSQFTLLSLMFVIHMIWISVQSCFFFYRYFLRVTIVKRLSDSVKEQDIAVHTLSQYPEMNSSIKMEVGIEDCLHIEFEYNKSK